MTRRIAVWASLGFIVACGWVLYSFLTAPEQLIVALREPVVKTLLIVSCPLAVEVRTFPVPFWAVPLINAVAVIGASIELVRRTFRPQAAV